MSFAIDEHILLKVSPTRGVMRFGKKEKFSPSFIGPFKILEKYGDIAYRLALPPNLSAHQDKSHMIQCRLCFGLGFCLCIGAYYDIG